MPEQKTYNDIIAVDEEDNVIGYMNMMLAIEKGYLRRAARVYVFNELGHLLVQRRSRHILKPLLLDQSCAGHVDAGESYEEAAYRELKEELGLDGFTLEEIVTSFRTTDFFNAVYRLVIPSSTQIVFDPHEVEEVMWYAVPDLDRAMVESPDQFTPAFKEVWYLLRAKLLV